VNVSAPHPAATQCHIVASVYFSFHYITYRNVPCETIPYQIIPTTHTHHISLVACINLHKCMNACVHYSVLHKLLSVTYIADIALHTHTFYTTLFRYIPHIHYTPDILCIPNIHCIPNTHYVSLRTIHTGHYNTNILDTRTQTTRLTQTNASDIIYYLRDMT